MTASLSQTQTAAGRESGFGREVFAHAWRYLRQTRPLILPLAAGPILLVLIGIMASLGVGEYERSSFHTTDLAFLCFVSGGLFALAFGAAAFAGECESGTDALLRRLPIHPGPLIVAVFAAGVSGAAVAAALALVLLAVVDVLFGDLSLFNLPWPYEPLMGSIYWMGLGAAFLAWGVFYSLKIRRVIWAAVLAAATAYISDAAVTSWLTEGKGFTWEAAAELTHFRLALVALVVFVDAGLIRAWLRPEPTVSRRGILAALRQAAETLGKRFPAPATTAGRGLFSRQQPDLQRPADQQLHWLQVRQTGALTATMTTLAIVTTMTILAGFGAAAYAPISQPVAEICWNYVFPVGISVLLGMQATTGVFVFGQDRWRGTRRFLAPQPIPPGKLWLTRQRWGIAWCAIWTTLLAAWITTAIAIHPAAFLELRDNPMPLWLLPWGVVIYAAGQSAGMFAPGILHALILAGGLTLCGGVIPTLLFAVGPDERIPGLSFTITLAVLVVALVWQTRRSIRNWLEDRPSGSLRERLSTPILWGLIVIWFGLPWTRVLLIPRADSESLQQLKVAQRRIAEPWMGPLPEGVSGFNHTMELARLVRFSQPLSTWALYRETSSRDAADDATRKQFLESESAAEFFRLVAEIPKMPYFDVRAAALHGEAGPWPDESFEYGAGWFDFQTIPALENFARSSVRAGEIDEARSVLIAALCLRFRAERTYPRVFEEFYAGSAATNWWRWGDIVWEWSRTEGQTPQSLRDMLHEIRNVVAREQIPLGVRVTLIGDYWREGFLSDAGSGMGREGPRIAWWPGETWFLPIYVTWSPGEGQLHRARVDRLLAKYLPMAVKYDERGVLPWRARRRFQLPEGERDRSIAIGWRATEAIRRSMDAVFRNRLSADVHVDAACLRLAIRAYQFEHGRYPERLEELVPNYLPEIPIVAGSGRSFTLRFPPASSLESGASPVPILNADGAEFPLEPRPSEDQKESLE